MQSFYLGPMPTFNKAFPILNKAFLGPMLILNDVFLGPMLILNEAYLSPMPIHNKAFMGSSGG